MIAAAGKPATPHGIHSIVDVTAVL